MPKYRVAVTSTTTYFYEVEAETPEHAEELVENDEGGEVVDTNESDNEYESKEIK